MEGHILGQRHCQVKAQGQVRVALLKTVDLLLGFAAALGKQHLAGLDDGGVQRGEAVEGIGLTQNLHHPLHLLLRLGQQLHKAREGAGRHFCHVRVLLYDDFRLTETKSAPIPCIGTRACSFVVPPNFGPGKGDPFVLLVRGAGRGCFHPRCWGCLRAVCRSALSADGAPLCSGRDRATPAPLSRYFTLF